MEVVVGVDGGVFEIFDLLEYGIGMVIGEDVVGD